MLTTAQAIAATSSGFLPAEITPITVKGRKTITVSADEELKKVAFDKLGKLRPAFQKGGSVTAGNSSAISDGAAAVVLASPAALRNNSLVPCPSYSTPYLTLPYPTLPYLTLPNYPT